MKKTTGEIKRSIYDLLPDTSSLKSAKMILLILHVFRALTEFKGSYGKIKKAFLETVDSITKMKSFKSFDAVSFLPAVSNVGLLDTKEIQKAVFENLPISLHMLFSLENSQHRDYKAVTLGLTGSAVQSVSRCVNALPDRKNSSNLKTDLYYTVTDAEKNKAESLLASYLLGKLSKQKAKAQFSKLVK